jgi:hypothetical protein
LARRARSRGRLLAAHAIRTGGELESFVRSCTLLALFVAGAMAFLFAASRWIGREEAAIRALG